MIKEPQPTTTAAAKPPKPGENWVWHDQKGGGWVPGDHPLAASASPTGGPGQTAPAGTTQGGVKPASPVAPGSSMTVSGGAGHSSLTQYPGGQTTATAPSLGLGNTAGGSPIDQQMRTQLLSLLKTDPTQASVTDADLAPQANAYAAARERSRRDQQAANATAMGSQGIASSGAADSARNQGFESAGQDTAAFNAGLVGQKLQQKQEVLETALQYAQNIGMTEEAQNLSRQLANLNAQMGTMSLGQGAQGQALQAQLANMDTETKTYLANLDADLRRQGYSTTERLASMDNELRRYGIDVQGNLGVLNAVIQMMGMDQQNTQFNDSLGWDMSKFQYGANNGLIASLLNG